MRTFSRGQSTPAGVLDFQLLFEESNLVDSPLKLGMNAMLGPSAASNRQGHNAKGNCMQQGGLDVLGPASWESIESHYWIPELAWEQELRSHNTRIGK